MNESMALGETRATAPARRSLPTGVVHGVTAGLVFVSVTLGFSFWADWFTSIDRIVCTICVAIGLIISISRSWWNSDQVSRVASPSILWGISLFFLMLAVTTSRPKFCAIALGLAVAGWFAAQMKGESVGNAIAIGLAFMVPALVKAFEERNAFVQIESLAVSVTSGLADVFGQSHYREGNTLYFGYGIADQFSCVGKWDSIVTFLGISLLCVFAFRRNLISGLATCSLAFFVWIAVRATAWVILSLIVSSSQQTNATAPVTVMNWSFSLEIGLFLLGGLFIVSLDQLFGSLLAPIPVEFINPDFPLVALFWNSLVGLPSLNPEIPTRSMDIEDFAEDYPE
jgi:hypothetical protein